MNKIVIAPNAFKHTLTATEAAIAIRDGLIDAGVQSELVLHPVGDGGDGTGELLIDHFQGKHIECDTEDALGRKLKASYGYVEKKNLAIIEMARASGIALIHPSELDPLKASSYGTGILLLEALTAGATDILITLGGSATVDGATGMLRAIGARFLDIHRNELTSIADMLQLDSINISGLHPQLKHTTLTVLCDVSNPFCGPQGAAAVFGPQKGATPAMIELLDKALQQLASCIEVTTDRSLIDIEFAGAAGGAAGGLYGLLGAKLVNGIDAFLSLTHFKDALNGASLVITGEGRVDRQTLHGKAPFGVAMHTSRAGVPTVCIGGSVDAESMVELGKVFSQVISCEAGTEHLPGKDEAAERLRRTAEKVGLDSRR